MPEEFLYDYKLHHRKNMKSRIHHYKGLILNFLTKIWIGISALMLCVVGFGSARVAICRIIYVASFLILVLTMQVSFATWRKMVYWFWLLISIYSLLHIVLISAYQFDNGSSYVEKYAGIPIKLHHDIGLEVLSTNDLAVQISTITILMIVTCVQLRFHKEFLAMSDIRFRNTNSGAPPKDAVGHSGGKTKKETKIKSFSTKRSAVEHDISNESNYFYLEALQKISYASFLILMSRLQTFFKRTVKLLWKFLELHMTKIVLVSIVLLSACDVCVIHTAFIAFAIFAIICGRKIQIIIIHICSTLSSLLLLSRMIYQLEYFKHERWETNCSGLLSFNSEIESFGTAIYTFNYAAWVGFQKSSYLPDVLKGYIGIVLICTFYAVVRIRQKMFEIRNSPPTIKNLFVYSSRYFPYLEREILFFGVNRENADDGIIPCIKFFFNYGFYKFGVEICLITTAIVIGVHMDACSIVYSIWLCLLVCLSCHIGGGPKDKRDTKWHGGRNAMASVWIYFLFTTAILLFLQYILAVGFPSVVCTGFLWYQNQWLKRLYEWLPLSDRVNSINMCHLVYDFILLLLVFNQKKVFQMERVLNYKYPGGCNRDIFLDQHEKNPVQDFASSVASWLDVVKRVIFFSSFWISLAVVFLAGTNQVNAFSLGYLTGCFIFLWKGYDFFLNPITIIFKWWNKLIGFNVCVILSKSLIQMLGCVFAPDLPFSTCWVIQLLGITCSKVFRYQTLGCDVPLNGSNLAWDATCLAFLLLQRRIFGSHYFLHVVNETKVQALLASRGAELIEELSSQQMMEQEDLEHQKLMKIKHKMEIIKESYKLKQGSFLHERASHYDAMLSGDYYMFEDLDDKMDEEILLGISERLRNEEHGNKNKEDGPLSYKRRLTLTELIGSAVKDNVKQAVDMAMMPEKDVSEVVSIENSKEQVEKSVDEPNTMENRQDKSSASMDTSISGTRLPSSDNVDGENEQSPSDIKKFSSQNEHDSSSIEKEEPVITEKSSITSKEDPPQKVLSDETADGVGSGSSDEEELRKVKAGIKFIWILTESLMITIAIWLNQFSKNYRYVTSCLAREKASLKRKTGFQEGDSKGSAVSAGPCPVSLNMWEKSGMSEKGSSEAGNLDLDHTFVTINQGKNYYINERSPSLILPESVDAGDKMIVFEAQQGETSFKGDKSPAVCLLLSLWYAIISNSDLVCYLTVIVHQTRCASLLSIPLPLMVFLWGTLSVPRPSMTFWVTIIAYTEVMVLIKCMSQFDFLPWNQEANFNNFPFFPWHNIGIEKNRKYAIYDLILLLSVFFHRFMLKYLGLWENTLSDNASPEKKGCSMIRNIKSSNSDLGCNSSDFTKSIKKDCSSVSINDEVYASGLDSQVFLIVAHPGMCEKLENFLRVSSLVSRKYFSSIKVFFHDLLEPAVRTVADVYAYMFMCDFFNFIVMIFGFPSFGTHHADGGVLTYIEENRIPVLFLIMLIVQSALMIIDRALYLKKCKLGKLIFQISLVIVIHLWMFLVLPGVTKREFNSTWPPPMFYIVKCLYLLLSAFQIRNVYPSHILGNFLSNRYNYVNMFLFIGFMNVPFLFELRAFMDWMWTNTTMTIFEWLILEDIFANIFLIKCSRTVEKDFPQLRGRRKSLLSKYLMGSGALLGIFAIMWFPLVFFSLENAVGQVNPPYDITLEMRFGAYQPIFTMTSQKNLLHRFTEPNWNAFTSIYLKNQRARSFLSNYDWEDVTVAKINGYSSNVWTISPPAKVNLIQEILSDEPIVLTLTWTITREIDVQDRISTDSRSITIDAYVSSSGNATLVRNPTRSLFVNVLTQNGTSTPVIISSILPKFLKVAKDGKAQYVPQLMKISDTERFGESWENAAEGSSAESQGFRNLSLTFHPGAVFDWWEVGEVCSDPAYSSFLYSLPFHDILDRNTGNCPYITIYTFNDKAFSFILKFISRSGIIGLYITFVFVASKLIHQLCTGMSVIIMYEQLPNVDRILQLCYDIYLVRENGEWHLEEDLYAKLLFLYRCPEILIKWTRPIVEAIDSPPNQTTHSPSGTEQLDEETVE